MVGQGKLPKPLIPSIWLLSLSWLPLPKSILTSTTTATNDKGRKNDIEMEKQPISITTTYYCWCWWHIMVLKRRSKAITKARNTIRGWKPWHYEGTGCRVVQGSSDITTIPSRPSPWIPIPRSGYGMVSMMTICDIMVEDGGLFCYVFLGERVPYCFLTFFFFDDL